MLLTSFKWMLDPESPLYIQPRLDPAFLRWLLEFLLASRHGKFQRGAAALVELCRVSVDLWEEMAKRSAEPFGFERHGLLAVYENAASLEAAARGVDLVRKSGVRAERWTADEVRQIGDLLEISVTVFGGDEGIARKKDEDQRDDARGVVDPLQLRLPPKLRCLRPASKGNRLQQGAISAGGSFDRIRPTREILECLDSPSNPILGDVGPLLQIGQVP